MRFALVGDHPDGLAMAKALAASKQHEFLVYCGPAFGMEYLRRWELTPRPVADFEDVLADPAVEMVLVASKSATRPAQLRRAVQSERHTGCVHPADDSPNVAYEAAMSQADTDCLLLPLLPNTLHPGVQRLAELLRAASGPEADRLVELEIAANESVLLETDLPGYDPAIPDWDILRFLGGEIVEVFGLGQEAQASPLRPLLIAGRFEAGGLFQMLLLPCQASPGWRLRVRSSAYRFELEFAQGWPGAARLTRPDDHGGTCEETWDSWDPWSALANAFTAAVETRQANRPCWEDEIRCLELDDAARRSVEKRRASTLEYQTATEEAGFKGTMTLVGCGMLWGSLLLFIPMYWWPWVGWFILPLFGLFLGLQILRWVVPPKPEAAKLPSGPRSDAGAPGKLPINH